MLYCGKAVAAWEGSFHVQFSEVELVFRANQSS